MLRYVAARRQSVLDKNWTCIYHWTNYVCGTLAKSASNIFCIFLGFYAIGTLNALQA